MNCVFCKIVAGDIPSYKIYENDYTLAFLDINPVSLGHTLVISKKHYSNLEETPEEELCEMIKTVKKVGLALKDGLGAEGYNILKNNDPIAGQIISHNHFHVVPRKKGDNLPQWPQGKYVDREVEDILGKIKNSIK
jgi:histidine triad (HIT) family protein